MREILFRGKAHFGWVYGSAMVWDDGHAEILAKSRYPKVEVGERWVDRLVVDPETVGQYAGLIDRNGKKIFEGDVVGTIMPHEVRFVCGGWMACRPNECKVMDAAFANGVSVIGNIYDNPELMEVQS